MECLRGARKEQVMELACRVQAEYGFRQAVKEPGENGITATDYNNGGNLMEE